MSTPKVLEFVTSIPIVLFECDHWSYGEPVLIYDEYFFEEKMRYTAPLMTIAMIAQIKSASSLLLYS